eukprot:6790892-Alexandrium_andersonii.AAC.1
MQARFKDAASSRRTLAGGEVVDVAVTLQLRKKLQGELRQKLGAILSANVWDAHSLHAVGKLDSPT